MPHSHQILSVIRLVFNGYFGRALASTTFLALPSVAQTTLTGEWPGYWYWSPEGSRARRFGAAQRTLSRRSARHGITFRHYRFGSARL